jgi:uncharacterized protein
VRLNINSQHFLTLDYLKHGTMTNAETIEMGKEILARDRAQQNFLNIFLESESRPQYTMNFYQLDGYLRAVCSGPGITTPNQWMPLIFNDDAPEFTDIVESEQVIDNLVSLYNFHLNEVVNNICTLPLPVTYSTEKEKRVDLEQWARGFLQGYIFWETVWNKTLDQVSLDKADVEIMAVINDEFDAALHIISTVADVDFAVAQGVSVEDLPGIFACLTGAITDLGRIGRLLFEGNTAGNKSGQALGF